jgi:hypothetical protein
MRYPRGLRWHLLAALAAAVAANYAFSQEADKPVVSSRMQQVQATITAVDPKTREISIQGPKGMATVVAGPEVRNFDKLHVGDTVRVSYYQGIAAQMAKGGKQMTEPAVSTFGYRAKEGGPPGAGAGASMTSTVVIEDVDPTSHSVAFRSSDGTVHVISAQSPQMQEFVGTLKHGDVVQVTYTESLAVKVDPSSSRAAAADDGTGLK